MKLLKLIWITMFPKKVIRDVADNFDEYGNYLNPHD